MNLENQKTANSRLLITKSERPVSLVYLLSLIRINMKNPYLQALTVGLAVALATCTMSALGGFFVLYFLMEKPDVNIYARGTIGLSTLTGIAGAWLTWPLKEKNT